jgi:hypothetical protein
MLGLTLHLRLAQEARAKLVGAREVLAAPSAAHQPNNQPTRSPISPLKSCSFE